MFRGNLKRAKKDFDKEHVTTYIRSSKKFKTINYKNNVDYSNIRWSLDQEEDLKEIGLILKHFNPKKYFSWKNILKVTEANKDKFYKN